MQYRVVVERGKENLERVRLVIPERHTLRIQVAREVRNFRLQLSKGCNEKKDEIGNNGSG